MNTLRIRSKKLLSGATRALPSPLSSLRYTSTLSPTASRLPEFISPSFQRFSSPQNSSSTPTVSFPAPIQRSKMSTTTDTKITNWVSPTSKTGEFIRQISSFRSTISSTLDSRFAPDAGRYHLYVSYACPWAHRTLIARKLKGLENIITFSVVHWHMGDKGWRFPTQEDMDDARRLATAGGGTVDAKAAEEATGGGRMGEGMTAEGVVVGNPVEGHEAFTHLREVYFQAEPEYKGRFTVPVLWDKKEKTIVNNESSEIIRMLYYEFDALLPQAKKAPILDLYPPSLSESIDSTNAWTYDTINNGVYKSGFATTQSAYTTAVTTLFNSLDRAEAHLSLPSISSAGPYYFGAQLTEADIRLFVTLIRFDPVYVQHFKCNLQNIRGGGYPKLHAWMRNLYWNLPEAFGTGTTEMTHIKNHYTKSHPQINPFGITPLGPVPDVVAMDA